MKPTLFLDTAATTRCCQGATDLLRRFAHEDYGNPSSNHGYGQVASRAIKDAHLFFANHFNVSPGQVIFTGSGTEADNLAIYGIALGRGLGNRGTPTRPVRILVSATEHPAVRRTALSLASLGMDPRIIPVDAQGQIREKEFLELLTPETALVSIQQVNNITGVIHPVERWAELAKQRQPRVVFHTDAIQAFGKIPTPRAPSAVDLVSLSGHKVEGPKGVGALIVLDEKLLSHDQLRPLLWGGDQESGFRAGTQNAGLIGGFHLAAAQALAKQTEAADRLRALRDRFRESLAMRPLLAETVRWNSPAENCVPHIVSLSVAPLPSSALSKLLEDRGILVSTGSACSSQKTEPDPVLSAMGLPVADCAAALRVSFSAENTPEDIDRLVQSFEESVLLMSRLLGLRISSK